MLNQGKSVGKEKFFKKSTNSGNFFNLVLTSSKFYPFYIIVFCAVLMNHSSVFYEMKNLNG